MKDIYKKIGILIMVVFVALTVPFMKEYRNNEIQKTLTRLDSASELICTDKSINKHLVKVFEVNFKEQYVIDNDKNLVFDYYACEVKTKGLK